MNLDPVIFCGGEDFFDNLAKKYKTHQKGLFIMTPSGAGKTYFCKRQSEPDWLDGDEVLIASGAQPKVEDKWWDQGVPVIERVEQRCDVITQQCVDRGFWIMNSINFWLKPDAIVIPEWDVLVSNIHKRQKSGNYVGGLTDSHHEQLKISIRIISEWNTKHGVPQFKSIKEAIEHLTS